MNKNIFLRLLLSVSLLTCLLFSTIAYASETTPTKDIPVGGSGQVEMVGVVEPTILSVTMPSFVPFSIGNSLQTPNKVISPRIKMKNNSNIPVQIDVVYTNVDLRNLPNVSWCDTGVVNPNQIAIGLKQEETLNQMPEDLSNAIWLQANRSQNLHILKLAAVQEDAVYVVGTLGMDVSENATFNVTPTFVVKRATLSE